MGAQAFPGLDELDGAKFRPGSPVVLVLGPSQATAETLERVSALLRATRGAGAVLVVQRPSAKLMSLALRSGVNDAIELSEVGAQLARTLGDLAYRLDEELAAPPMRHEPGSAGRRRAFVTSVFSPKGGVGKSVMAVNLATALAVFPANLLWSWIWTSSLATLPSCLGCNRCTRSRRHLGRRPARRDPFTELPGPAREERCVRPPLPTSPSEADHIDPAAMLRVLDLLRTCSGTSSSTPLLI